MFQLFILMPVSVNLLSSIKCSSTYMPLTFYLLLVWNRRKRLGAFRVVPVCGNSFTANSFPAQSHMAVDIINCSHSRQFSCIWRVWCRHCDCLLTFDCFSCAFVVLVIRLSFRLNHSQNKVFVPPLLGILLQNCSWPSYELQIFLQLSHPLKKCHYVTS